MGTLSKQQETRVDAGLSITAAAALAGVSPHTWKLFELNVNAIKDPKKRAACDAALAKLEEIARRAA